MSEPAAALEPRVQLDLSLEEATSLLAWLADVTDQYTAPVVRELGRALAAALEVEPMA